MAASLSKHSSSVTPTSWFSKTSGDKCWMDRHPKGGPWKSIGWQGKSIFCVKATGRNQWKNHRMFKGNAKCGGRGFKPKPIKLSNKWCIAAYHFKLQSRLPMLTPFDQPICGFDSVWYLHLFTNCQARMMELDIQESRAGGFGFNESLINLICNTIKGTDRAPKSPEFLPYSGQKSPAEWLPNASSWNFIWIHCSHPTPQCRLGSHFWSLAHQSTTNWATCSCFKVVRPAGPAPMTHLSH